jgi:hypothetical protein
MNIARRLLTFAALALAGAASFSISARAEGPAVSALNGKFSTEAGAIGGSGGQSALGVVQGAITTPLGHSFGLQVDGALATAFDGLLGGGAAHLFWRDPQIGLVGPLAVLSGGRGARVGLYGAEADYYAGLVTAGVKGGYQDAANGALTSVNSGGFYSGRIAVYPIPDLALAIEGGQYAGFTLARGTIEFQPDLLAAKNFSIYVDGVAGDQSFYRVTAGVRFYFGAEKSLMQRHREDDPSELPLGPMAGPGMGTSAPGRAGGAGSAGGNGSNGGSSSGGTITNSGGSGSSGGVTSTGVITSSGGYTSTGGTISTNSISGAGSIGGGTFTIPGR